MRLPDCKTGIFVWFGWRIHISQRAELIKKAGFDAVSLWWADEEKANTGSLDDLPKIVRDNGLEIDYIHVPFNETYLLTSENPAERQRIIDLHKQWIADCVKHNIPKIVFHTCPDKLHLSPPNKFLIDSVGKILDCAESAKIILAAENTRRRDYLDIVLEEFNSNYLKFCYDSGHNFIWDDRPFEILKKWSHRLICTHLHDNRGSEDDHLLPFTGKIDWHKVVANWPEDYNGILMLEVLGDDRNQAAQEFLSAAYDSLMKLKNLEV